jgi:chemotaxis protein histidine kinase CheA
MAYNRKTSSSGSYMQRRRHPTVTRINLNQAITAPDVVVDLDDLARRAKEAGKAGKWIPPVFDYCPACKQKQKEESEKQPPPPQDEEEEPPKTVDIDEQGEEESGPPQPQNTPPQQQQQNQKEEEKDAEAEPEETEKEEKGSGKEDAAEEEAEENEPESGKKISSEEEAEDQEAEEEEQKPSGTGKEEKESEDEETAEDEEEEEEGREPEGKSSGEEGEDEEETEDESEAGEEKEEGANEEEEPGEEAEEGEEPLEEEPPPVTPEDVEAAKKGASNVASEFDQANRVTPDLETSDFEPVVAAADPQLYRDQKFISDMNTALKDWRTGFKTHTGAAGSKFKVKEYIKSKGEAPFVTRIQQSAKGRKILVIGDFSGSVGPFEDDYKKAIVSSMEVLDGIGSKTAFFAFGGQRGEEVMVQLGGPNGPSYNNGRSSFFKIKKFEEPRWLQVHSAKTSALINAGSTPTAETYERLKSYIKKHRPDVTLTLTDGGPDNSQGTISAISELKHHTKMVAFGIGGDLRSSEHLTQKLKEFGYTQVFGVSSVNEIPRKLVGIIAPT